MVVMQTNRTTEQDRTTHHLFHHRAVVEVDEVEHRAHHRAATRLDEHGYRGTTRCVVRNDLLAPQAPTADQRAAR